MDMTEPARPRVTVLMPVRNEERHVVAAIQSVLGQSERSIEVLVIDGMSTDATVDLAHSLHDDRVRVLSNPRRTIPCALNVGLAAARGDFVARVDAHSTVNESYLSRALAALDADLAVAAVGGKRLGVARTPTGRAIAAALASPFGVGNSINHYATQAQDTDHASFAMTRIGVARAVGGWDENMTVNEDVDFDHRILALGHRIRFDPDMEIHWQVRETLPELARQYRRYGRGKAAMVRKNGMSAVRLRHLVAPSLIGALAVAAAAAVAGRPRIAAAIVMPYAIGILAATARTVSRPDDQASDGQASAVPAPTLAAAFVTMHTTWGFGFLEGIALSARPAASSASDPR
jgi:succinoglycan biosynthesis protein ExoA